jgi:hypothetical protein
MEILSTSAKRNRDGFVRGPLLSVAVFLLLYAAAMMVVTLNQAPSYGVRGVPECYVMGGMVEWDLAKTRQINRLICIGVEDNYPYAIVVDRDEWEKWTATLGQRWPGGQ